MHWEQLLRANHGKVRGICSSHMLLTNNRREREYILGRLDCRGMESLKLYLTVDVKHRMLWFEITCDSSRVIIIVSLICHVAPVLTKAAFPFMPT